MDKELIARLDERQKAMMDKLEEIHEGVKKTNGRVNALETWRAEIKGSWRATAFIASVIGAITGFVTTIIFNL